MIDPNRLQMLRAVEHHGTISEVARVMHLTPSAVSQQIRQLASEVGTTLLEREGRSIRLTPAAYTLLAYSHSVAAAWEDVRAELDVLASGEQLSGHLSLGSFATAIPSLVASAAVTLTTRRTGVTVSVREADTAESLTLLLHRTIDLAVVAAPVDHPLDDPRFDQHTLLDDPQDLVVAADSELATCGVDRLLDVSRERWVEPHHDQRRLIESACAMEGFVPHFEHQTNDWNSALALVAGGMGVCLYPRMAPINTAGVRRITLSGPNLPVRRVLTFVRAGSVRQPLISTYLRLLEQVVRQR
ncbi:LysR family transcriptional regulator [Nocardia callitridis]|uniref:LysR family transcriptional regulator n=1 Tax=Nocardia callitridis TaxID=648753 RepID=A0ABP9KAV6_9NOCA